MALVANMTLLQSPAQARSTELRDPDRTDFECTLSMDKATRAIKAGMRSRHWSYKKGSKPGEAIGRILVRGKHTLWVTIKYDRKSFDIDYKDSDNLNYRVSDDGTRYLHPNAISWMENLRNDIRNAAYDMCP
ncbi:conserved hypothetical protein [Thiolapillus brandeum]|uniref:Uncharacterized protein n=2 Tax=Thiolapillus brandeum TaxID=1076588 RepID=A0A7U6GIR5_9GAMM|nr:conserved hypothetical protein [Thiolapillus brandeum]